MVVVLIGFGWWFVVDVALGVGVLSSHSKKHLLAAADDDEPELVGAVFCFPKSGKAVPCEH